MRRLAYLPAVLAFLLNPSACSQSSDPQYQYGAEELRAAVEGTWDVTVRTDAGASAAFALTFKQRGSAQARQDFRERPALLRQAHACGTRTLIASADACIDSTEMPLEVTHQSGDTSVGDTVIWDEARGPTSLNGNFRVDSLIFTSGRLMLVLGDLRVHAQIQNDGTVTSAGLDNLIRGTATLERRGE